MESESHKCVTIAVDAMGGDKAPRHAIEAAQLLMRHHPYLRLVFFGDEAVLNPLLKEYPALQDCTSVVHTDQAVADDEKPSIALRASKNTSMRLAIEAVRDGMADAVVSAGNTGALMAISRLVLRTLPMIDRPAIVSLIPTLRGKSVMLDLGANAESTSENLLQFAIMGDAFAKVTLGITNPSIGLLNIGSEDVKGNDVVKAAAQLIKDSPCLPSFYGYIEGNDISLGTVDVVVTDGFSGNISIKTAEGTAHWCKHILKQSFSASIWAKLGGLLAFKAIRNSMQHLDHRLYNGAMLVGLNGIVVKSHGGADAFAFSNAIQVAVSLVKKQVNQQITQEIAAYGPSF